MRTDVFSHMVVIGDDFPHGIECRTKYRKRSDLLKDDAYVWATDQFGPAASVERFTITDPLGSYELDLSRAWDVIGATYYFRDENDAALFKLFWYDRA